MNTQSPYHLQQHITHLNEIKELVAWPDVWVMRFQRTFATVENTGALLKLDPRDYLTRTAAAFGWSLKELRRQLDENYLQPEFLGLHDEELAVLDTML